MNEKAMMIKILVIRYALILSLSKFGVLIFDKTLNIFNPFLKRSSNNYLSVVSRFAEKKISN
jgi:hypothetical protein